VRFARDGETLVTLDGVERALDPSVLVIADAEKPVALAGIMGGANSEVTAATKNILLESAAFDPVLIRRTSRKLGLASDSSYRFERGVFWDNVLFGADRALDLMLEEAGGRVTARTDTGAGRVSSRRRPVVLNVEKMNAFLGGKISAAQVKKIFKALGFTVSSAQPGRLEVVPPDFRPDVIQPEDLYEEVARIIGYDNLPSSFPTVQLTGVRSNPDRAQRLKIADLLLSQGFNEVLTYSLVSGDLVREAGFKTLPRVSVRNPLSREQDALRPHLLPCLLQVAATNLNRGQRDLALFETGKVYLPGGEQEALGLVLCGCLRSDWREPKARPFDFYDMKGAVERTLSQLKLGTAFFSAGSQPFFEDGQQADVAVGKMPLGSLGKVSSDVLDRFGIKADNVFFAQLDLGKIYRLPKKPVRYISAGEFPSITRDVSIAVDGKVAFDTVCGVVREFGGEHLKQIDFKEEYLGEKIPAGQRGLVFSVIYQSSQRTLTEDEIQTVHDAVCQKLQERLGAVVR